MRSGIAVTGLAVLFLSSACDRATRSAPAAEPYGSFHVALVGDAYQLYVASGTVPSSSSAIATFAAALAAPTTPGAYSIGGFRARAGYQDALTLDLEGVTAPGTFSSGGILNVGIGSAIPAPYMLAQITVEVTALSASRIMGTFDGIAVSVAGLGDPVDTLEVQNGIFDVPIIHP